MLDTNNKSVSFGKKIEDNKPFEPFPIPLQPDTDSDFPSLQMTTKGDVISIGGILKAADPRGHKIFDIPRFDGTTLRHSGAVIYISIQFDNKKKWDYKGEAPPTYIFDVN